MVKSLKRKNTPWSKFFPLKVDTAFEERAFHPVKQRDSHNKSFPLKKLTKNMEIYPLCLNPLYTGGLHYYMLDESIYQFWGVRSILPLLFYFRWKILLVNNVDHDQLPHYVASDLGLCCLPLTFLQVPDKNGLRMFR